MTSLKKNTDANGEARGTVVGLFRNQADAERAIRDLKDAGIDETRIGVAMLDRAGQRELGDDTAGGILGGVVGLLPGVGALAIPGVGPVIVGGTLASALAGAGIAATGGLIGTLVTMGVREDDAMRSETGLREGNVLVTATAGLRGPEAREILRASGADPEGPGREAAGELDLFGSSGEIMAEEETWRGSERRYHDDMSYGGPERRYSHP
jgi:hypothetical protein